MARHQRNSVDYFPHPVTHGKGMFYLRQKYQNDGYAVWMILLEQLGRADYHFLDLTNNVQIMYLSAECMVPEETLLNVINDLIILGEFDRELWEEERILFNQKFISSIEDAYKKRQNQCIDKNSLLSLLISKGRIKQPKGTTKQAKCQSQGSINTQRKEKKRKEDKKENKGPLLIFNYYLKKIQPMAKTERESLKNIEVIINGGIDPDDLFKSIDNFSQVMNHDPKFRKHPKNFFNPETGFFEDYLPGVFKTKEQQLKEQRDIEFKKSLEEDRVREEEIARMRENSATPLEIKKILKTYWDKKGGRR